MKQLYVHLDQQFIGVASVDMVRGRETWSFRFTDGIDLNKLPLLDPAIANVTGPQYPLGKSGFGFLADVAPDRWGRKLIRRREKRDLREADYVLGVCDLTRIGAIRVKEDLSGPFVADDLENAAPPWTTLRKLEAAAILAEKDDTAVQDERWLRDLILPGSSLGGARPKANVTAPDGTLWIAKFPSPKDEWDIGEKEYATNQLARKAGLMVPEAKRQKLSKAGTTFFSKRFDRDGKKRIHYASAMTMLGASDGEDGHSYLEIAEWICANSADATADLHELWGRMVFSKLIHNTDDHLRNHGFLLTPAGWRLAPMFDVNPNPDGGEGVLDMGDLIADAPYYRLDHKTAQARYAEIKAIVEG